MSLASPRFLRDEPRSRLEELFELAHSDRDNCNAAPYFERLARQRYLEVIERPQFNPGKPSIISSFQPKSGGTFLHNRLLEIGYQEFWWCFPHALCHSYWYSTERALQLYLRGGVACHTHFRPVAGILTELDRCGVEKIWVHLRNPAEAVASAYHHYRGEGHGGGAVGEERRRQALSAAKAFCFRRNSKSAFVRQQIDWFNEWVGQWLEFDEQNPGLVVFSYHREMTDLPRLLSRVLREFGVEAPPAVTQTPQQHDRFRENPHRDWRSDLDGGVTRFVEKRIRESLGRYSALDRLWT